MQAILACRSSTSNRSMREAPLFPARMLDHVASTLAPSGVTIPRPVTTTRLIKPPVAGKPRRPALPSIRDPGTRSGRGLGQELHGVSNRQDGLGGIVGNLAAELFLEGHDKLDRVERVRAEVVDEARVFGHLLRIHAEVL